MTHHPLDTFSPENHQLVKVDILVFLDGVENAIPETVEVHRGQEYDKGALRDALNRTDIEDIEILN